MTRAITLALLCACATSVQYGAKPALGDGIRVDLREAALAEDGIRLDLSIFNSLDDVVFVDTAQLIVIGPEGTERSSPASVVAIGKNREENLSLEIEGGNYAALPGVFLRFDGVYYGESRVQVASMIVGAPQGTEGAPGAVLPPPEAVRHVRKRTGLLAQATAKVKEAAGLDSGVETYSGPRSKIAASGTGCAALPLRAIAISQETVSLLDELLLAELQTVGFKTISPDDINAMVGLEAMRDAVGCDDPGCVSRIGSALNVPYLAHGTVAESEGSAVLTLKLIDVANSSVVTRTSKIADGGRRVFPRIIAEAVQQLVKDSRL